MVSDITANSAVISWMPGNSNYPHCIEVNGQDVHLLRPGVCKYTVTGNSIYIFTRCSSVVRAFVHGAMGHRIDPSWGGPIELFLVPTGAPQLV